MLKGTSIRESHWEVMSQAANHVTKDVTLQTHP